MTEKFKVGDEVRITRTWEPGERGTAWGRDPLIRACVGKTGKIISIEPEGSYLCCVVRSDCIPEFAFPDFVLEHVKKSHAASILTEKVTIGGVPCRKILGFEGILSRDDLPEKYNKGLPKFHFDKDEMSAHRFVFDGKDVHLVYSELSYGVLHFHVPDAEPKIESYGFCMTYMNIGDILPEKTFQQILVWLKRAGSRLAKIRKQEKAAWSGKETIEI